MTNLQVTENIPTRDLVLRKLRDAILSGHFQPGQRLLERELVEQMGVSRTPIREALRKLELEGLVTTIPYRGPTVARPTVEDARALYEVRAALEGQAVALFTSRAGPDSLKRLRSCLADAEASLAQGRIEPLLAANNAFHDEIAAGCGNALLQSMLANLRDRIVLLRVQSLSHPGRPPRSVAEHRAIVLAVEKGDAESAKALSEEHILHAWQAARAQLAPDDPPHSEADAQ